jgi:hypothetical protein
VIGEQIFDQQIGRAVPRLLEPDLADRLAVQGVANSIGVVERQKNLSSGGELCLLYVGTSAKNDSR